MRSTRLRLPSPAMMVALLALFVALTGGAYAAAKIGAADIKLNAVRSKHIKAKEVKLTDLAPVRKFRRVVFPGPAQTVLRLAGLEVTLMCAIDGINQRAQLTARTTVDNAYVDLGVVSGTQASPVSFWTGNSDFDVSEPLDIDQNRFTGRGTLVYSRAGGPVVSVTLGWFSGPIAPCQAHGIAFGG